MRRRIALIMGLLWLGLAGAGAAQPATDASTGALRVEIDARQMAEPVSKYEYGMFIEHISSLVYRNLWSEMLDDRKFYFPITPSEPAADAKAGGGPFHGLQLRKWHPVGPGDAVVMDAADPFVGEHSPRIVLDGATPRGIRQTGFSVVAGKRYTGHIWLRGTPGAKVEIALQWGADPKDRQTVTVSSVTGAYTRIPLHFTAGASTDDASFAVTGTGSGSFHIGSVSLMPADNVEGFRPEVIALLRQLHSGFWRLPGGNFIADFSWYDSVGERDRRPPVMDDAWNAVQSNDVGMDEFMTLCRLIGVEPYITVNANFGDAHSAAEEVEYMNGAATTRMGAMRARNGHPEPYHVKFWNIGNEPYGPWELGRTDLKYYVLKHNEFARAMRKADPSITLLASGAMPDEMVIEGIDYDMHVPFDKAGICSDVDWTCGFLKSSWGNFDGVTEHWYARAGMRMDLDRAAQGLRINNMEPGYVPDPNETLLEWVRKPSDRVRLKAEEWQEYERRYPQMVQRKIFMSNDEYAYMATANLKLAMAYAMVFNEMLRHTDFLRMTAFTMGVSTMDITPTAAALNTNGLLFKLYGDAMGAGSIPVTVEGNAPQPAPAQHIVGDLPKTSAGSPTYPLDIVAALSPDRKFLTLAVVNATEKEQSFALNMQGIRVSGAGTLREMTGKSVGAANHVGQAPQVAVTERPVDAAGKTIRVAPISISMFRFPVAAVTQ